VLINESNFSGKLVKNCSLVGYLNESQQKLLEMP